MASTIVAFISDLMFQSRLREQVALSGYELAVADTVDAGRQAFEHGAALAVVDLHDRAVDWREAVALAVERGVPVLAFGRHTEAELLRSAREAGCTKVVPRSAFVERLPELIDEFARAAS